ncbi:RAMP superfamily CRISPR-associated protein [Pelotomaculum propionicicum]|uniref:RAMP superfamily CRISPR-associated protein n=1 Tax=Pelotomaculum propionicicum TaxID=258475 RepID=UPI003B80B721
MKTIRFEGIYTLLSPLCHMAPEVQGEEKKDTISRLRVIPFNIQTRIIDGYGVSGAEVRSLLKMLVVNYTLEKLGLTSNDLPNEVAVMLYSGGTADKGATIPAYEIKNKIQKEVPLIGLFGGVINGCFFSSTLRCDFALMLSKESSELYNNLLAKRDFPIDDLISADYFKPEMYRYGHARHRKPEIAHLDVKNINSIQVPYHIEAIPTGTKLLHGFSLIDPSEGDEACFEAGLKLLLDYGFLGGRSAAGYGRVSAEYFECPHYDPFIPSTEKYDNWLMKNGENMKAVLLELTQTIKSKADVEAPKACKWLVKNKAEIERLVDGTDSEEDRKKLFKSTYIGDLKKFEKVIKAHRDTVLKAVNTDCSSEELFETLDDSQSKELAQFHSEIIAAVKSKNGAKKKKQGA